MKSSEVSTCFYQLIESFDLLIVVPFSKVFKKNFGVTKFKNC